MKKLVCLLAVIALAASASAAISVTSGGMFQSPWTAGDYTAGTDYAQKVRTSPGWVNTGASGTTTLAGNEYIEFDVYFGSGQLGTHVEAMHFVVNGDDGWKYKWQQGADTWVDGVHYTGFDQWNVTQDSWHHIKVDLKDNCGPVTGLPPVVTPLNFQTDNIGLIRLHTHWTPAGIGTDLRIRDMAFTPEPATIALLGLGGLALIRRKR